MTSAPIDAPETRSGVPAIVFLPGGDDSADFFDRRCGFFMRLPGAPSLSAPPATTGEHLEPVHEAVLRFGQSPVTLRYRLSELPAPRSPQAAIALLTKTYAHNRCREGSHPRLVEATPAELGRWNAEAAASQFYPLARPDESGADTEEVLVLYRHGQVVTIAQRWRFAKAAWTSYTLLKSVLLSTLRFVEGPSPGAATSAATPLFPPSSFLAPGLSGALPAALRPVVHDLRARCQPERAGLEPLFEQLSVLFSSDGAPTEELSAGEKGRVVGRLEGAAPDSRLGQALVAMLPSVTTRHDLRGLCLLGLTAAGELPEHYAAAAPGDEGPPSGLSA